MTVEVTQLRYEELIKKEERLNLLEKAICSMQVWESIEPLKKLFELNKGENK